MTRNQIEYWNLQEQKRSNAAKEQQAKNELAETIRSNQAREFETARYNRAQERLGQSNIDLGYDRNAASRYAADTGYASSLLGYKSNAANIALGYANLAESARTHKANESITSANNAMNQILQQKSLNLTSRDISRKEADSKTNRFKTNAEVFGGGAAKILSLLGRR